MFSCNLACLLLSYTNFCLYCSLVSYTFALLTSSFFYSTFLEPSSGKSYLSSLSTITLTFFWKPANLFNNFSCVFFSCSYSNSACSSSVIDSFLFPYFNTSYGLASRKSSRISSLMSFFYRWMFLPSRAFLQNLT